MNIKMNEKQREAIESLVYADLYLRQGVGDEVAGLGIIGDDQEVISYTFRADGSIYAEGLIDLGMGWEVV
jgi:hypothetical protein